MQEHRWFIPRGRVALAVVVLVVLFAGYLTAFRGHVVGSWEDPDDWGARTALAAAATLFSYLALAAVVGAVQAQSERRRIGAILDGAPLRDGEFAAVEGKARAAGAARLVAPFSGRACLAYEYEVWLGQGSMPGRQGSGEGRAWAGLAGIALAPTAIDSGAAGSVRLLGWTPLQTHFRAEWFEGEASTTRKRLKALLKERRFEQMTGLKGLGLFG